MTTAHGLPDFAAPLELEDAVLYPAAGEVNHFICLPRRLEVAPRADRAGKPDFSLELVRGQSPFLPPEPYGVLDFRVRPASFSATALAAARASNAGAVVTPVLFQRGYLRLQVTTGSTTLSPAQLAELETPFPLVSNGLDTVRFIRRLSPEAATLLKEVLVEGRLTFSAVAEMEILGRADRMSARVTFQRSDLQAALAAVADAQARLTYEDIVTFWMQAPDRLPLAVTGDSTAGDQERLARALADWTVASFTTFVAAPDAVVPTWQLKDGSENDSAETWDLSQERMVPRVTLLQLDPFQAAQQLVATEGLEAVWQETVVPPLESGVATLVVGTNLPHAVHGILKLGVSLLAPPKPPLRPHPLSDSLLFDDPEELHRINWRFSPQEPVRYEYTTFVLLREAGTIRRLLGEPTPHDSTYLLVGANDFPLSFIVIGASELLLQEANVRGIYYRSAEGAPGNGPDGVSDAPLPDAISFALSLEQPQVSLALPREAVPAFEISLEACAHTDGASLPLGPFPARSLGLDLPSFPHFGPQTVEVTVEFDGDVPLVALDFLPEDEDDPEQVTVLTFTPALPSRRWHYFAPSPFRSGYRYRRHDDEAGAWSALQSPFPALTIRASEIGRTGGDNADDYLSRRV